MVTYLLQDTDGWLTAARCDTLQLNRAGRHWVIKRFQREVLAKVVTHMDKWARLHMHWLQTVREEWRVLVSTRKRGAADGGCLSPATRPKRWRISHDGGPCVLLLTRDLDAHAP